jgi:hypothetical protein
LLSCGSTSRSTKGSGIAYRAFFTEQVSAGTASSGVYIVDAQNDLRNTASVIGAGNSPGRMVLTPSRAQTLVFSGYVGVGSDNQFTVINNATETAAGNVTLPGFTESFVVTPDSNTAYVAVPTATVVGQSPGVVKAIALSGTPAFTGEVDIPAVRYLSISNSGARVLAFSDNSDLVAIITPTNIGVGSAVTYVGGFDRPVTAFFSSDDKTAYVVNCGAECGGAVASIQPLDMNTNVAGTAVPVPGATVGVMQGSTLYLAGTPVPAAPCTGQTTQATSCGLVTVFDLTSMSVTNTSAIPITDGYHNVMAMGANGQLFIGARTCTEISVPNATNEVRGCLSIYNTRNVAVGKVPPNAVFIPPGNGDATGIQPIAKRTVVYVVQNGALRIYDAMTDALEPNPKFPNHPGEIVNLVGDFYDVKTIDF